MLMSLDKDYLFEEYVVKNRSTTDIAKDLGCAYNTINRWLRIYGIPIRGQGTHKIKDITNKVFNSWKVIRRTSSDPVTKFSRWVCKCVCGTERIIHYGALVGNKRKMCRECFYKLRMSKNELPNEMWSRIKNSAKERNIDFDISRETVYNCFVEQDHKCALSGIPIGFARSGRKYKHEKSTASLDRIDSKKGYIDGNVQWVHKDINKLKRDFDESYFFMLCNKVAKNKLFKNRKKDAFGIGSAAIEGTCSAYC